MPASLRGGAPSVPGHYVLHLMEAGALPAEHISRLRAVLDQFGLAADDLARADTRIPLAWLAVLAESAQETPSARLAWEAGLKLRLTSQGILSTLIMTSATLRDALSLTRFMPLLSNSLELGYQEDEGTGHLFIEPRTGSPLLDHLFTYFAAAALLRLAQLITGSNLSAELQIAGSRPDDLAGIDAAARWHFDAAANRLSFKPADMALPSLHADAPVHRQVLKECGQRLSDLLDAGDAATRVRFRLETTPPPWTLAGTASALHMSPSTLKRQLMAAGTSFNDELQQHRRHQATRLLLGTRASLAHIAEQLGYSDQSNFTHAFRRWTGLAPAEFRKGSQGDATAPASTTR